MSLFLKVVPYLGGIVLCLLVVILTKSLEAQLNRWFKNWLVYRKLPAELKRVCICGDRYLDHYTNDDDEGPCVICPCTKFEEKQL